MSQSELAIEYVLSREDLLNENPNDLGGITNFGISLRFLRELSSDKLRRYGVFEPVTEETIRQLTIEQAKFIYRGEFWENQHFYAIESQHLCNYFFDMAVNMGIGQATRIVQRAIKSYTVGAINEDGVFGSKTLAALNFLGDSILPTLIALRATYYMYRAEINPKQKEFLNGWLNRAYNV